jgi:hypothetical protein
MRAWARAPTQRTGARRGGGGALQRRVQLQVLLAVALSLGQLREERRDLRAQALRGRAQGMRVAPARSAQCAPHPAQTAEQRLARGRPAPAAAAGTGRAAQAAAPYAR